MAARLAIATTQRDGMRGFFRLMVPTSTGASFGSQVTGSGIQADPWGQRLPLGCTSASKNKCGGRASSQGLSAKSKTAQTHASYLSVSSDNQTDELNFYTELCGALQNSLR